MDEGIIKSLKCNHEVENVLIEYVSVYYGNNKKIDLKTETVKMVCIKCKELITKEYVIDIKKG